MNRLDKADLKQTSETLAKLREKILSEMNDMLIDAQTILVESKVLDKFKSEVSNRKISRKDVDNLRDAMIGAIVSTIPNFETFWNLVVEKDRKNPKRIAIEFKIIADAFID